MAKGAWYNGYTPQERQAKLRALKGSIRTGEVPPPKGLCAICCDGESGVEYHSEDYDTPYLWSPPAVYVLCRHCHRAKLHRRFRNPTQWNAFLGHVRRGGYARDLKHPEVRREVGLLAKAVERAESYSLRTLRDYPLQAGAEWFSTLRMDEESLTDPRARPRG